MRQTVLMVAVFLIASSSCGRERPLPGNTAVTPLASPPSNPSEIEKRVFPPELIMERQSSLGLTSEQRTAIQKEVERAQGELQPLQWDLGAQKEQLAKLLEADQTDEALALAAAEKVMAAENKVKAAHFSMLLRIKNLLTPEQQKQLRSQQR